jgi:dipeptidyl aminopeptidase/acylaminoacyl peptidase
VRVITGIVLSCMFLGQVSGAQRARGLTVKDVEGMKAITATAISPDGSKVLYTVEASDMQRDVRLESVWVISAKGGVPTKILDDAAPSSPAPAWCSDGKQFAYISAREGTAQVCLSEARAGATTKLTNAPSDVSAFAWSPDARTIAYLFSRPAASPNANNGVRVVSDQQQPKTELRLADIKTKADRQVDLGEGLTPEGLSWSPDSKQIVFSANDDIYVVEIESGKAKKLVERPGVDSNPQWSPDGKQIAFVSNYGQAAGAKVSISVIAADGNTPPQDKYQTLDFGFGGYPPRFLGWSDDSKSLYVSVLSRMTQNLYSLSLSTGESRQITRGTGNVFHDFSFSRNKDDMAFLETDPTTPDEVYVSSIHEFRGLQITNNTNPQLSVISFGKPEVIRWRSNDGVEIEGLLLKPVGYEAAKKYPLLVQMEGTYGTYDLSFTGRVSADTASALFPFQQQIFAAEGYVVLMPNPRGSWGYGEEFRKLGRGDYGIGPYHDIMSGVDYLIALGIADPDRLGIMGLGFDGYRTAFTITQTNRFKAAAVGQVFGFDLVSWYGQSDYYQGFLERMIGGPPWKVPESYARLSPINFAGNLKTPTLVFHFDLPSMNWIVGQSQELYTSLKKNNVPAEYVIYSSDGNDLKPKVTSDLIQRNVDWFSRWIKRN